MTAPERWSWLVPSPGAASKPEMPGGPSVQLQPRALPCSALLVEFEPHAFAGGSGRQRRAAVEALGVGEGFQRAGQRALALAGGGDIDPGAVVLRVDQGAAQRRALGAGEVAGRDG